MLRCYPDKFGARLLEMYEISMGQPVSLETAGLRFKPPVSMSMSDKELFHTLPIGDLWAECELLGPFLYLYHGKHTSLGPHLVKQ